jgi:hypothetical protein
MKDTNEAIGAAISFARKNLANDDCLIIDIRAGEMDVCFSGPQDWVRNDQSSIVDDILACVRLSNPKAFDLLEPQQEDKENDKT